MNRFQLVKFVISPAVAAGLLLPGQASVAADSAAPAAAASNAFARVPMPKSTGPKTPIPKSIIESLTGPVTANEIAGFRSAIAKVVPGDSNTHNNYAYGNGGHAIEACGDMYGITGDRAILDQMILFCDQVVSIRNSSRKMWTGKVDPLWPNNPDDVLWGGEQGEVAGHLAYCAQLIGQTPALWQLPVAIGDTHGYGKTYRARAAKYLEVVDQTLDLFYQVNYIRADESMVTPSAPQWPDAHSADKPVPWNQQAMIGSSLVRGAEAHYLFKDHADRVAKYRQTARASVDRFVAQFHNYQYRKHDRPVCKWSYSGGAFAPGEKLRYAEDVAHGGNDINLMWRASHWLPGGISRDDAMMLANTVMEVVKDGDQFFTHVDGTGPKTKALKNSWAYLSEWRPDVFPALVKTGEMDYSDAARKLWIKNAINKGWPAGPQSPP